MPRASPNLGGPASAICCGDEFCAALTPAGAVAWGGPLLGGGSNTPAQLVVHAPGATRLASGAYRLVVLDASGAAIHLLAVLDARTQSADPQAAARVVAPANPTARFIDVGGGGSLFAALSSDGEAFVFGDAGALVPVPSIGGVAHFTAAPAHLLAVDSHGRLCRLCAALQASASSNALPLLTAAAEGAQWNGSRRAATRDDQLGRSRRRRPHRSGQRRRWRRRRRRRRVHLRCLQRRREGAYASRATAPTPFSPSVASVASTPKPPPTAPPPTAPPPTAPLTAQPPPPSFVPPPPPTRISNRRCPRRSPGRRPRHSMLRPRARRTRPRWRRRGGAAADAVPMPVPPPPPTISSPTAPAPPTPADSEPWRPRGLR